MPEAASVPADVADTLWRLQRLVSVLVEQTIDPDPATDLGSTADQQAFTQEAVTRAREWLVAASTGPVPRSGSPTDVPRRDVKDAVRVLADVLDVVQAWLLDSAS